MKVTFELNRNDIWNFNKYSYTHIPSARNPIIILFLAGSLYLLLRLEAPLIIKIITIIIYWAVMIFLLIAFLKLQTTLSFDSKPGILGEHTIEISPECLFEMTSVNESKHYWNGIRNIYSNDSYIFIFINKSVAHIIPKRAFNSSFESKEFLGLAYKYCCEKN